MKYNKKFLVSSFQFPVSQRGSITAPLLVISASFIIVIYGLIFLLSSQLNTIFRQTAFDQSLYISEAGIDYYRWHLAHSPENFTDNPDQGCTDPKGKSCHFYKDPQSKTIGMFTLEITPPNEGSSIVTIASTGYTDNFLEAKRTVTASYGIPSLARYSNLSHESSWYGEGITVNGLVHSNTGIRMDGVNTSIVSCTQASYTCGTDTGCSPSRTKPGVWGAGPNSNLWQFPYAPVDFDSISFDFGLMRTAAIETGVYRGPSNRQGYHVTFKQNGTFDLNRVNTTSSYWGYSVEGGCQRLYQIISSQSFIGNFALSENPIIFLEDTVWVEGIVNGKTTLVAARFPIDSNSKDIWINGNITYLEKNGNHNLGLVSQNDIYFIRNLPENFEINAALLAQKGKIIRHGYHLSTCGNSNERIKDSLSIYGTVISFQKSYWNFGSSPSSGFITRTITYDGNLLYSPPPYFPTNGEYEFISWEE